MANAIKLYLHSQFFHVNNTEIIFLAAVFNDGVIPCHLRAE